MAHHRRVAGQLDPGDRIGAGFARIAGHFHVLEAVEREAGLPGLLLVAFADIGVRRPGAAQVGDVDGAVGIESLGETQDDSLSGLGVFHFQANDAGEVGAHVEDVGAVGGLGHADGLDLLELTDRDARMGLDLQVDGFRDVDAGPGGVIGDRFAPVEQFGAGVVKLAHEKIAFEDRSGGRLPAVVGQDDFGGAVGKLKEQLGREARGGAVVVTEATPADETAVPAVGEDSAEDVEALFDLAGDIVGIVVDANFVVGPARREVGVADFAAVEIRIVVAERRGVQRRPFDRLIDDEALAEVLGRWQEQLALGQRDLAPGPGAVRGRDLDGLPISGVVADLLPADGADCAEVQVSSE